MKVLIAKGVVSSELRNKFAAGSIDQEDVVDIVSLIKRGKERMRVLIGGLYMQDFWLDEPDCTDASRRKKFTIYLKSNGYSLKQSYLSKVLRACQIEEHIAVPYGTYRESVLRSLTPLLAKGKEKLIRKIWKEVIDSVDGKEVTVAHVKKVIKNNYAEFIKSNRGRPPKAKPDPAIKPDFGDQHEKPKSIKSGNRIPTGIPTGIQLDNDTPPWDVTPEVESKKEKLLQRLLNFASKVPLDDLRDMVERVEKKFGCLINSTANHI